MNVNNDTVGLFNLVNKKSSLKNKVYKNTFDTFGLIKECVNNLSNDYLKYQNVNNAPPSFEMKVRSKFELDLKFGGDMLLFNMHTNVFEFSRHHEIMRTSYIKNDKERSYCGVINIYNFIADSFKFNRINDIGYLIGRIFINKDNHYFIEGKRELKYICSSFEKNKINTNSIEDIIKEAVKYTINFDLLTPDYDLVKYVTVNEMKSTLDSISLRTGKRLGYKFHADTD